MATTGAMTDYTEDAVLDEIFNKVAFSVSHTYISLYTATPADTGGASGTEVSASGYTRTLVYPNSSSLTPKWALAADTSTPTGAKKVANANTITWSQATANWGSIKAFAVHNNSAGGTMIWYGVLDSTKAVSTGDTFKFDTSALAVTLR